MHNEVFITLYSKYFFRKRLFRECKWSSLEGCGSQTIIDNLILPSSGNHETCTIGI